MESDDDDDDLVDDEELCAFVVLHGLEDSDGGGVGGGSDQDDDDDDDDKVLQSVQDQVRSIFDRREVCQEAGGGGGGQEEDDGEAADEAVLQSLRKLSEKIEGDKSRSGQVSTLPEKEKKGSSLENLTGNRDKEFLKAASGVLFGGGSDSFGGVGEQETQGLDNNIQLLQHALDRNKQCQEHLRSLLLQVEQKKKENAEIQRRVKTLVGFEKYCRKRSFRGGESVARFVASLASLSYSNTQRKKHRVAAGPEENKDVDDFRTLKSSLEVTKAWSSKESQVLKSAVRMQVQQHLLVQAMEDVVMDVNTGVSLEEREREIDNVSDAEVRNLADVVDWEVVSRGSVPSRTGKECKARWMTVEDTLINRGSWSKAEDLQLLTIAKEFGFSQWESVAEKLGTYRTPADCLIRYQRSLNAKLTARAWTAEEDEQLKLAVDMCGEGDWQSVAACLEARTPHQARYRWKDVLTEKKRGRWSIEEDKRLKCAVMVCGARQWKSVASRVPGRSEVQCRERWRNSLDPQLRFEMWTPEEDKRLEEAVEIYGHHKWSSVAAMMEPRTDNQCWRRWMTLHPESRQSFHLEVKLKKELLPLFAKRNKERPELGVDDIALADGCSMAASGMDEDEDEAEAEAETEAEQEVLAWKSDNEFLPSYEKPDDEEESPGKPDIGYCKQNSTPLDAAPCVAENGKRARTRTGRMTEGDARRKRPRKTVNPDVQMKVRADGKAMRAARLAKMKDKRRTLLSSEGQRLDFCGQNGIF